MSAGDGYEITEYGADYGDINATISIGLGRSTVTDRNGSMFTTSTVLSSSPVRAIKVVGKEALSTSIENTVVSSTQAIVSDDAPNALSRAETFATVSSSAQTTVVDGYGTSVASIISSYITDTLARVTASGDITDRITISDAGSYTVSGSDSTNEVFFEGSGSLVFEDNSSLEFTEPVSGAMTTSIQSSSIVSPSASTSMLSHDTAQQSVHNVLALAGVSYETDVGRASTTATSLVSTITSALGESTDTAYTGTTSTQQYVSVNGNIALSNITPIDAVLTSIQNATMLASGETVSINGYSTGIGTESISIVRPSVGPSNDTAVDGSMVAGDAVYATVYPRSMTATGTNGLASSETNLAVYGNTAPSTEAAISPSATIGTGVYTYPDTSSSVGTAFDGSSSIVQNAISSAESAYAPMRGFAPLTESGIRVYPPKASATTTGSSPITRTIWNLSVQADRSTETGIGISGSIATAQTVSASSSIGTAVVRTMGGSVGSEDTVSISTSIAPIYVLSGDGVLSTESIVIGTPELVSVDGTGVDGVTRSIENSVLYGGTSYSSVNTPLSTTRSSTEVTASPDTDTLVGRGNLSNVTSILNSMTVSDTALSTEMGRNPTTISRSVSRARPSIQRTVVNGSDTGIQTRTTVTGYPDVVRLKTDSPSGTTRSIRTVRASAVVTPSTTNAIDGSTTSRSTVLLSPDAVSIETTGVDPFASSIEHSSILGGLSYSSGDALSASTVAGTGVDVRPNSAYVSEDTNLATGTTTSTVTVSPESAYAEIRSYIRGIFIGVYFAIQMPTASTEMGSPNTNITGTKTVSADATLVRENAVAREGGLSTEKNIVTEPTASYSETRSPVTTLRSTERFKSVADKGYFVTTGNGSVTRSISNDIIYPGIATSEEYPFDADTISRTVVAVSPMAHRSEEYTYPAWIYEDLRDIQRRVVINGVWDISKKVRAVFDDHTLLSGSYSPETTVYGDLDTTKSLVGSYDPTITIYGDAHMTKEEQDITLKEQETAEVTVEIEGLEEPLEETDSARFVVKRSFEDEIVFSLDETEMEYDGTDIIFTMTPEDTSLEPTSYDHEIRVITSSGREQVVAEGTFTVDKSISTGD